MILIGLLSITIVVEQFLSGGSCISFRNYLPLFLFFDWTIGVFQVEGFFTY